MKDLTILIQGPYFEFQQYNSNENIKILEKAFSGADIFVSTWKNEKKFNLAENKIIYNEDPGPILDEQIGLPNNTNNVLRQIVSVCNGLQKL